MNADVRQISARRLVVIGLLGSSLDAGLDTGRWERWRPTVAMCGFDDLRVDRVELLSQPHFHVLRCQILKMRGVRLFLGGIGSRCGRSATNPGR